MTVTFATSTVMPWETVLSVEVCEMAEDAARRHGVRLATLRVKAKAIAGLRGRGTGLPSHDWDRVASACVAARQKRGPKPCLHTRRALVGRESFRGAAVRLGVNPSSLRSRAVLASGGCGSRASVEWDVLAKGLARV